MSQATATGPHGGHEHPPFLQHHFDTPAQQFDSSKFGMWLFLATEILLFGGLFCAYAIYRANHPEIFVYAHTFLDTTLGGINTVILLSSSLTMAWGVRAAQLGQRRLLIVLLGLTLLGGFGFMGIKFVEYKAKFEHGLLWARSYAPEAHGTSHGAAGTTDHGAATAPAGAPGAEDGHAGVASAAAEPAPAAAQAPAAAAPGITREVSLIRPAARGPVGLAAAPGASGDGHSVSRAAPANVQVFFSIYFLMTGLHGLHVLAGMASIAWLMFRAAGGAFGPEYYTPVDLVGLYWHLVDLIWIFLFPLLYLIH